MDNLEQKFLSELDKKLWDSANKLRANLDAANYKHIVLGLIFLKYVSDAFVERQTQLMALFQTDSDDNIYYFPGDGYDSDEEYQAALQEELEVLDYYREANVFWVPKTARWSTLKEKAVLPTGSVLWQDDTGKDVKLRSVSWLVDNALEEIEKNNSKLKGILNRVIQYQLDSDKLIGLINAFSDTSFTQPVHKGQQLDLHSKDILGHVYEYFLGDFALAEGKQGGQYYTPKSIVTLIVEMLQPFEGRVYDPAMGSGGFFVSSDKFIEQHASQHQYNAAEQRKHISVYGQESNPTTWKLAAMQAIAGNALFASDLADADATTRLTRLQTENPEQYATLRATAELFPAAMQESELGEIPEGWGVAAISDFGKVVCGKTPSKRKAEYYGADIPFIKIPDMHGNVFVINATERLSSDGAGSQPKKNIPKGSVCVSCIATVRLVVIAAEDSHTNQQINSVIPTKESYTPYLYFRMKSLNKYLHDLASGGSATLNLNTGHFSKIQIIKPMSAVLDLYQNYSATLLNTILENSYESEALAELRDTLLPKLLSGELDVSNV